MKIRAFIMCIVLAIAGGRAASAQEMVYSASKLVRSLLPSVVNITAFAAKIVHNKPDGMTVGDQATDLRQLGSGFVIDSDGTIVTNYHVVENAGDITVTFSDGDQASATLRSADRLADIAILHVDTKHPLAPVTWATENSVQVGDPVIAIGNPLGVGMSVTAGIVSALNRNIMETPYDDYIQTDAPINHGNSGGPLFDMRGKVVGINTAIISPTKGSAGLGFAIPAADALFVINRLETYGWIRPGWLGMEVQHLTPPLAEAFGLPNTRGAIVDAVLQGSPAAQAGIQAGDVVLDFRGREPTDARALLRAIGETPIGTKATLTILRAGRRIAVRAEVGEFPRQKWEAVDVPVSPVNVRPDVPPGLGLTLAPLPEADRVRLRIGPETPAVLVAAVAPGSDAAWRGLGPGDAIEKVQDAAIARPEDFSLALKKAEGAGRRFIALLVAKPSRLKGSPEWVALRLPSGARDKATNSSPPPADRP